METRRYESAIKWRDCEVRIWNVLRSQEEIYRNMYDVDPQTTGLKSLLEVQRR